MNDRHFCYIIVNPNGRTYTGYTTNPERRLRQHNGELVGGAKSTRGRGPWSFFALITAPELDRRSALSLEWWLKHPTGHRRTPREYQRVDGRLRAIPLAVTRPRFVDMAFEVKTWEPTRVPPVPCQR